MAAFTGTPASAEPHASQNSDNHADAYLTDLTVHLTPFSYTHAAGAGTGEINLCTLPAGHIRVLPQLSRYSSDDMGASAVASIGHRAYTQADGTVVAEDVDEWAVAIAVGVAAIAESFWSALAAATLETDADYDNVNGLTIFVAITAGNIEDTDKIDGYVAWARV